MRVLWFVNTVLPQVCETIGEKIEPLGGWLVQMADVLSNTEDVELFVGFPYAKKVRGRVDSGFHFFSFINGCDVGELKKEIAELQPDIIHIWGTERQHSYTVTRICREWQLTDKMVLSTQGIMSECAAHYADGLSRRTLYGCTLRDVIKRENVYAAKKKFERLGRAEKKIIALSENVIGRTEWDRAILTQSNPNITYYCVNEMLRKSFYSGEKWDLSVCRRHRIFVTQAHLPLKGFHVLLKALHIVNQKYEDIEVEVSGKNFTRKPWWSRSAYENYIIRTVKRYGLQNKIHFTGFLDEKEMNDHYLESHLFVLPSSIENSPNSLAEAQFLGVPSICSYVGGVPSMVEDRKTGVLYRFSDYHMLAHSIDMLFSNEDLCRQLSANSIAEAERRHDRKRIVRDLLQVYQQMLQIRPTAD